MENSINNTLNLLQQEFPNLEWIPSKINKDVAHAFTARFCGWWELRIEVLPIGSIGFLTAGHSTIVHTPNEQGKTLEEVVSQLRREWDEIAHCLSKQN